MKRVKSSVLVKVVLCLVVLVWVTTAGSDNALAARTQLRIATHYPSTQVMGEGYTLFAKMVEEKTKGKIKPKIYPGETLISSSESFEAVKSGTVDGSPMISNYHVGNIPHLDSFGLPFQFKDHAHFRRTLDNGLFTAIAEQYAKHKIKILNYFPKGAIHIFHKSKHLMTPADFKGADLRGLGGYITMMIQQLGANAVTIGSPGEVTIALQRGVIHGITTNYTAHVGRGWWEFAPYVSYLNLSEAGEGIGINMDYWNDLTPDEQKIFMEAAKAMNDFEWKLINESDETECFKKWEELKCPVKKITPQQQAEMSKVLQPLFDKAKKELPMAELAIKLAEENLK